MYKIATPVIKLKTKLSKTIFDTSNHVANKLTVTLIQKNNSDFFSYQRELNEAISIKYFVAFNFFTLSSLF